MDTFKKETNVGAVRKITDYYIHPEFTRTYFDVGIAVANRIIEFTDFIRPINLPMRPIDDENEDAFAGEFVNLAGWSSTYDPVENKHKIKSTLRLVNLEVNDREYCEEIYSKEYFDDLDISPRLMDIHLPRNFTREITCVGNTFDINQGACDGDRGWFFFFFKNFF